MSLERLREKTGRLMGANYRLGRLISQAHLSLHEKNSARKVKARLLLMKDAKENLEHAFSEFEEAVAEFCQKGE